MENITSKKSFFFGRAVLLGLMLLFTAALANAQQQTVTFAQYTQRIGGQDFIFNNNGTSATFQTTTGGSPINFSYLNIANLPIELQGIQNARVFFSSTTTAAATTAIGNRTIQPFNNVFNILIFRDSPASSGNGNRTNLLTVTITTASSNPDLSGEQGGRSAAFTASTPIQNITYTSDFLDFANTIERDLSLGFTSIAPVYSLGTTFLQSFTAAGTGSFASNPPPVVRMGPSAATLSLSGRVLTPKGRGLANAKVTLTTSSGVVLSATTDENGFYKFVDVEAGDTVILEVKSKLYDFAPQVLNLTEETSGLNFTATNARQRIR